jgi:hypothetical protein
MVLCLTQGFAGEPSSGNTTKAAVCCRKLRKPALTRFMTTVQKTAYGSYGNTTFEGIRRYMNATTGPDLKKRRMGA